MEILIHIETKKIDTSYKKAIEEYVKRTSPFCKVSIKTYKNIEKISFNKSSKKYIVIPGKETMSSPELADMIQTLNLNGCSCIEFIISENKVISDSSEISKFCISSFGMNVDLNAVVLTEQIYRAYTILNNITYHK